MVAIADALKNPDRLGPVKSHETLEQIAGFFVETGATNPAAAIPLRIVVKGLFLRHKISRPHLYRVLADKPGFVTIWQNEEKNVYYEAELVPVALEQGARYYPLNTASMFSQDAARTIAEKHESAWKLSESADSGRIVFVPALSDAAVVAMRSHFEESVRPHLATVGIKSQKQMQNFISLLTTLWENGEFDDA